MSKELQKNQMATIMDLLEQSKNQFAKALPKHLTVDRLLRIAVTTIRTNEKLMRCTPYSLVGAIMQAAQLGLEPDGILGQAYLIPYGTEAQFQVGYKGLIALARRSGEVKSLSAHVVFENDVFEFAYGTEEKLKHVPNFKNDRGKKIVAYAIAHFKDGGYAFDVMTEEEIAKTRKSSKAKSGPWFDWEEEMWRKTVTKRLAKYLPLSVEFQQAAQLDEHYDMGLNVSAIAAKTEEKTQALSEKLAEKTIDAEAKEPDKKETQPKQEKPKNKPSPQTIKGVQELEQNVLNTNPDFDLISLKAKLKIDQLEDCDENQLSKYGDELAKNLKF